MGRSADQRAALHDLALGLARRPEIVRFARALAESAGDRCARIGAVFNFVTQLAATPLASDGRPRDGVDALVELVGESEGPAVVLSALLQALGERARIDAIGPSFYVRVALEPEDLARLPPHARLIRGGDRVYLPLDPGAGRRPLGIPPPPRRPIGHG